MGQAAIDRAARTASRTTSLGASPRCEQCGWTEPTALTNTARGLLCYECLAREQGRSPVEAHHVLGRANDPLTIFVPGNLHRQLSDRQRDWPDELRHHAYRDPLLWIATALVSLRDMLSLMLTLLDRLIDALPKLASALRQSHGEDWWTALNLGMPWPSA